MRGKNIIIHDYFENFGGGERLIISLDELFSELCTGFVEKKFSTKNFKKLEILNKKNENIIFKKIKLIKNFKRLKIDSCENVLCSGNYSIFSNLEKARNKIIYIHSLPKLFFRYSDFYKNFTIKKLFALIFKKYGTEYLKKLNEFDKIIVNSNYTKKSIKNLVKKKIYVVAPPIVKKVFNESLGNYYFSNNRHEPEKNLEIVINVFKKLNNKKLIISSTGSLTKKLKKMSIKSKNIKFVGLLNNKAYHNYLSKCAATINVSSKEDFGMAALEGMAYGKPTFCLIEGGYLETTKHNHNAIHIIKNKYKTFI